MLENKVLFFVLMCDFYVSQHDSAAACQRRLVAEKILHEQEPTCENVSRLLSSSQLLQALEGFLLVVTADGTILYVSRNIVHSLGFNQVDLMHRCIYGIVHPDDHHELKMVLETSLLDTSVPLNNQKSCCSQKAPGDATCKSISFLVRIKCFNGTTTGYLKMQCSGHIRLFPGVVRSSRTSNQVVFAFCRPFSASSTDSKEGTKTAGFWSKHGLDLRFKHIDVKMRDVIGYDLCELDGESFYPLVHPEDLGVFSSCHKALLHTEDIQTMYFRIQMKGGQWTWLHTRGKVVFKNSKKYSIVFTHCPVRVEDSTYIQQEAVVRRRDIIHDVIAQQLQTSFPLQSCPHCVPGAPCRHTATTSTGYVTQNATSHSVGMSCPSTWHSKSECHSPVFPTTSLPHRYNARDQSEGDIYVPSPVKRPRLFDVTPTSQSRSGPDVVMPAQFAGFPPGDATTMDANAGWSAHERHQVAPPGAGELLANSYKMAAEGAPPAELPQRRYLMQVNGIGVSGEAASPTTLYFQGQFTTFVKPPTHPVTSHLNAWPPSRRWEGTYSGFHHAPSEAQIQGQVQKQGSCAGFQAPLGGGRGVGGGEPQLSPCAFPNVAAKNDGSGVPRLNAGDAYAAECQQSRRQQLKRKQQQRQHKHQSQHRQEQQQQLLRESPQQLWSNLINSPVGNDTKNGCSSFDHVPNDVVVTPGDDAEPTNHAPSSNSESAPRTSSSSDQKLCAAATRAHAPPGGHSDRQSEVTPEVKAAPWRAACLYQSCSAQAWTSAGASCFRPPSPADVTAGGVCVKTEWGPGRGGSLRPAGGESDLPNIGSFLEYLKDISG